MADLSGPPAPSPDTSIPSTVDLKILSQLPPPDAAIHFTSLPTSTTVAELKEKIRESAASKPSVDRQRLIYRGHVVTGDTATLASFLGQGTTLQENTTYSVHLVIRDSYQSDNESARPNTNTNTQAPAAPNGNQGNPIPTVAPSLNHGALTLPQVAQHVNQFHFQQQQQQQPQQHHYPLHQQPHPGFYPSFQPQMPQFHNFPPHAQPQPVAGHPVMQNIHAVAYQQLAQAQRQLQHAIQQQQHNGHPQQYQQMAVAQRQIQQAMQQQQTMMGMFQNPQQPAGPQYVGNPQALPQQQQRFVPQAANRGPSLSSNNSAPAEDAGLAVSGQQAQSQTAQTSAAPSDGSSELQNQQVNNGQLNVNTGQQPNVPHVSAPGVYGGGIVMNWFPNVPTAQHALQQQTHVPQQAPSNYPATRSPNPSWTGEQLNMMNMFTNVRVAWRQLTDIETLLRRQLNETASDTRTALVSSIVSQLEHIITGRNLAQEHINSIIAQPQLVSSLGMTGPFILELQRLCDAFVQQAERVTVCLNQLRNDGNQTTTSDSNQPADTQQQSENFALPVVVRQPPAPRTGLQPNSSSSPSAGTTSQASTNSSVATVSNAAASSNVTTNTPQTGDNLAAYLVRSPAGDHFVMYSGQGTYSGSSHRRVVGQRSRTSQSGPQRRHGATRAAPTGAGSMYNLRNVLQQRRAQRPQHAQQPQVRERAQPRERQQMQEPPQQENEENDLIGALTPLLRAAWLAIRVLGFIWFFTSGGISRRSILIIAASLLFWAFQAGLFGERGERLRRHWEGILGLPAEGEQQQQQQPQGEAQRRQQARQAQPQGLPQTVTQPPRDGSGGDPSAPTNPIIQDLHAGRITPQEAAERLAREQAEEERRRNSTWLSDGFRERLRGVERAAALFVASLFPGVGERHVAARERMRRDEEERQRREAATAAQEEADAERAREENDEGQAADGTLAHEVEKGDVAVTTMEGGGSGTDAGEGSSSSVAVHSQGEASGEGEMTRRR